MVEIQFSIANLNVPEGTTDLVVPFKYVEPEYIHVYKGHYVKQAYIIPDGVQELGYKYLTPSTIRLLVPVQGNIQIVRTTPIDVVKDKVVEEF